MMARYFILTLLSLMLGCSKACTDPDGLLDDPLAGLDIDPTGERCHLDSLWERTPTLPGCDVSPYLKRFVNQGPRICMLKGWCKEKIQFPLFYYAAWQGDTELAELLLKEDPTLDINKAADEDGELVLHRALVQRDMPLLKWALNHGADTNIGRPTYREETDKYFPLGDAWSEESIDLLLKHGAKIDDSGALAEFAHQEQLELVKVLLARGAKPSYSALARGSDHIAIVKVLLEAGAKPKSKDSVILWGAKDLEIATMLLDAGFPINVHLDDDRYHDAGETPLHRAVQNGDLDMVRLFIARGAKVNAANKEGETALFWAVGSGTTDMVNLLLARGAKVDATSKKGMTPLFWAVSNGTDMVNLLLDAGADINHLDEKNQSILLSVLGKANLAMLKLLIERGSDVTIKDRYDRTALYYLEKHNSENQEGIDILKAAATLAKKPKK